MVLAPPGLALTDTDGSRQGHVVASGDHVMSTLVPSAAAVMAVGEVTVSQIQSRADVTRAYTPGCDGTPQRNPKLVTPSTTLRPVMVDVRGPPESPEHVSFLNDGLLTGALPAQIIVDAMKLDERKLLQAALVSSGMPPDTCCRIVATASGPPCDSG